MELFPARFLSWSHACYLGFSGRTFKFNSFFTPFEFNCFFTPFEFNCFFTPFEFQQLHRRSPPFQALATALLEGLQPRPDSSDRSPDSSSSILLVSIPHPPSLVFDRLQQGPRPTYVAGFFRSFPGFRREARWPSRQASQARRTSRRPSWWQRKSHAAGEKIVTQAKVCPRGKDYVWLCMLLCKKLQ